MIQHLPVISIMVLFLGAFLTIIFGSKNKKIRAVIVMSAVLISNVCIALLIKPVMIDGQIISYWLGGWELVAGYAIGIAIEVDGLGLLFGCIVSIMILMSALYSFKYMSKKDVLEKYYVLFLMLSGSVMGLVLTGDLFNMYVMIEIMTFAAVALTAFNNNANGALEAAFKYLVVGVMGSGFILLGTILIYSKLHTLNMAQIATLLPLNMDATTVFAFALLFAGFGVKAFIVPFHPVAADAHMSSPASFSMLFSGVVNKTGVYALIRLTYLLFQVMGLPQAQGLVVFLGTISMFIGVTMALTQHDFKRLLAFHSISQIGYMVTAIGLSTALGLTGGLFHLMNHALFKGLLFLSAGAIIYRTGTSDLDKLGGLSKKMPKTTILFLMGAFSISGLPPFNGFVSKWYIYQAIYDKAGQTGNIFYAFVTIISVVVSVMTLASFVKVSQSVFFGQLPKEYENIKETPTSMRVPMWIMAILCVVTGVIPDLTIKYLITPAVNSILNVGKYIDSMMGEGYYLAERGSEYVAEVTEFEISGYWNPVLWLVLFVILLLGFAIATLFGNSSKGKTLEQGDKYEAKYDTFFGGERSEFSHVAGSDLFWGLKHNLRHYFGFLHNVHSGIVNDYAMWAVCACALIVVFAFIFL